MVDIGVLPSCWWKVETLKFIQKPVKIIPYISVTTHFRVNFYDLNRLYHKFCCLNMCMSFFTKTVISDIQIGSQVDTVVFEVRIYWIHYLVAFELHYWNVEKCFHFSACIQAQVNCWY